MTVAAVSTAVRRSVGHRKHAELGAQFERRADWEVPSAYSSESAELEALRAGFAFADISARGKVQLDGAVDAPLKRLTGAAIARLARDWALVLAGPAGEQRLISALGEADTATWIATDMTSAFSGFLIAGPRLDDFLSRSVSFDFDSLWQGRCAAATWARIPAVLVVPAHDERAVELYVASDYGRYAWETIVELARPLDGTPVGWRALESWGWS